MVTVPIDEIRAEASESHPGRALATAFTAIFVAIGWLAGAIVYTARYCGVAIRYGYRQGARVPRVQPSLVEPSGER